MLACICACMVWASPSFAQELPVIDGLGPDGTVIIVVVDGLRPDLIAEHAPTIARLAAEGAATMDGRTVWPIATLPAITSMLTGLDPRDHEVTWNDHQPERGTVKAKTIFDIAHAAGMSTALFAGKVKIRHAFRPDTVDLFTARFLPDASIVVLARSALIEAPPNLMFVHLPNVDRAGHEHGWRSDQQYEALHGADAAVAAIVDAAGSDPTRRVRIILTADHGGEGRVHSRTMEENQRIPWILWGDGIAPRRLGGVPITITAAVALRSLGLDVPESFATPAEGPQEATEPFPWPMFRGPAASGIADGQDPPVAWDTSAGYNVLWSTPIPGLGHSSPVVWGDRIFLTTAVSEDPDPVFRYGTDGRQDRRSDRSRNAWYLYAVDRHTGEVLWAREAINADPTVQRHPKNSYASATPATDGEHVVALVATGGLFCYDFDGELLWAVDLGPLDAGASYDDAYQWGAASSPIIWQDMVIVQADQQEGSFIAAFDIDTGEEAWRTRRDLISSFSTPMIHVGAERTELVTNGAGTMHGYDPRTGEELWRMSGSSLNTTPTPVGSGDLIYVTSGYRTRPIFAIREGATGDISLAAGDSASEHVAWSSPRDGPYIASPLVYRGHLYVVSANGVLTVFDAATGEPVYKRRIGDRGGAYSASPIAADGRIYLTSEDGDVFVLRAGPEYELLAVNRMGEVCLATPAISEGQMFIRTTQRLVAVVGGDGALGTETAAEPSSAGFPERMTPTLVVPFDDFEDADLLAHTGVRWQTFTNGVSTVNVRVVDNGASGTTTAARVDGELAVGAVRGPLAQMYQPFDRGAVPVSLEDFGGIRFYARGSRPFELTFNCADGEFGGVVEAGEEWRLIEIGAAELAPVAGAEPGVEWNGQECRFLTFSRRGAANTGAFWFEVDEITMYGTEAWQSRQPSR